MDFLKYRCWLLGSGLVFLLAAAWLANSTGTATAGEDPEPTINCVKAGDLFAFPGDTIAFTITCTFNPPASTSNPDDRVIVNDFLDLPGLVFDFNSLDCPDATTEEFVEPATKQQAHCEWTTLANGVTSVQMFVDVLVEEDAECGGTLPNKVTGDLQTDIDKEAEASTQTIVQIRILCPEDVILSIEKTPDDETISGGGTAEFTIEVTNSGDIDVIVNLFDQLPGAAGLNWNLISGPTACEPDAGDLIDCDFPVGSGETLTIIVRAETDLGECGEELLNEATVTFVEPDEENDLVLQQIGPILEATDTGSISVECLADTPPPTTGRPTPSPDIDQLPPTPPAQEPGVGRGPSVTTGDSGVAEPGSVTGLELGLLATVLAATLFGSLVAYRRLR